MRASHPRSGRVLAERLATARGAGSRALGLMFRRSLGAGEGLWIMPCNGIHMMFMNFSIDAVFVDRRHRVVRVCRNLRPWVGMVPLVLGADSVLELPAGTLEGLDLARGESLLIEPRDPADGVP